MSDSLRPHESQHTTLSITNSRSLLKLMSIDSVMPSNHLILYCTLLLLPLIPPSIRVFSNESTLCMRWPKYWSFCAKRIKCQMCSNFALKSLNALWIFFLIFLIKRCETKSEHGKNVLTAFLSSVLFLLYYFCLCLWLLKPSTIT